ncbi:MAG: helix-turn-helix transcriptional regulator [Xanthomonadaceae bacterium]|nr:helix-turn-helix transcriptional regulator [Xanthomonadaceae bacterium]
MDRQAPVGHLLRHWREQRRVSQLALALEAEVSSRHLSFVENGRARPSRALILRPGELLDLPLRERNRMLLSGGFSPQFAERDLSEPALTQARAAVCRLLDAHDPYPALAVDRHWNLLLSNAAARRLMQGVAAELLSPQPNVLRISLHPRGLAPAILNLGEWRRHLFNRLRRLIALTDDSGLAALYRELADYPRLPGEDEPRADADDGADIMLPFRMRSPIGELSLFSTLTVFGTPTEITLSDLAIESFFPADQDTAERLRQMAG